MIERGDNSGVYQYGRAEHFTHIISDKPSPKDKYVAYAINIPDYELAADVYNINVTSPSGQQETFKILINLEHLRQTLERKSLTAVQKSQCEIITPKKPGEAILHAFNATYQQIRENMSEFARCHYGYIQIPPVTTFRADGPETPERLFSSGWCSTYSSICAMTARNSSTSTLFVSARVSTNNCAHASPSTNGR